jgi:hypothetical protein
MNLKRAIISVCMGIFSVVLAASQSIAAESVRPPRHRHAHRSTAAETMPALSNMDWKRKAA